MKIFKNVFWTTLLLIIYVVTGVLSGGNHIWISFMVLIGSFVSAYYYLKINKKSFFYGFFMLTGVLLMLLASSLFFGALPKVYLYMIFVPICNLLGWYYAKTYKKVYMAIALTCIVLVPFVLLPNALSYMSNQKPIVNIEFPDVSMVNNINQVVNPSEDKIVILDFWTTACGVCFKKFPDLEEVYLKYKNNPEIELYSVNIPLKRDSFPKTVQLVKDLNYKFPTWYATDSDESVNALNITAYPYLIIIKNKRIRYQGVLNIDKNVFVYNTIDVIEKLIKEN